MTAPTPDLVTLLVAALAAALLGLFKWAAPKLQAQVPGFLWPLAAVALGIAGSRVCTALDAACSGNPLNWGSPEASALAVGLYAVTLREGWKWLAPHLEKAGVRLPDAANPHAKPPS